jgi:hypothetical protein
LERGVFTLRQMDTSEQEEIAMDELLPRVTRRLGR